MKIKVNTKFSILSVLDTLVVLFVILATQSMFYAATVPHIPIFWLLISVLSLTIIFYLPYLIKQKVSRLFLCLLVWWLYSGSYILLSGGNRPSFIQRFMVLFSLLIIYYWIHISRGSLKSIFLKYVKIIITVAVLSLVFWLLGSILGLILPSSTISAYWGREIRPSTYYFLYFQWQNDAQFLGRVFYRNIGIFTEAPMFSLHLSFAFLLDYFILKRQGFKRLLLYGITFLTTVSVTGILLFGGSIILNKFIKIFDRLVKSGKINPYVLLFPLIVIVALVLGRDVLVDKLGSGSGSSRMSDYEVGIRAWLLNPWFGAGYGDTNTRISLMSAWRLARSANGFTNSPTAVLAEGGIYFFLIYAYSFLSLFFKSLKRKNGSLLVLSLMLIYLFITTTFEHSALMIAFLSFNYVLAFKKIENKGII